mmetsp:Transcript_14122/g.41914  ORF Transcript_14122/g.41914 Transcript_14122/m.41914 type:complete len:365 (+) Transcript_14122:229-1323(+)
MIRRWSSMMLLLSCHLSAGLKTAEAPEAPMSSAASGYLAVSKPLWKLDTGGTMVVPTGLKHFSLDIGVNKGLATRRWLEIDPDALVIGVEANSRLVMMLTEVEKPNQPTNYVGWLQTNQSIRAQRGAIHELVASALTIKANTARTLIINAAAGRGGGARDFNTGAKNDDTGSLFSGDLSGSSPGAVPMVPLGDILQHVPLHLRWDVLKIDVQGADVEALLSAGKLVRRFACVVGEYDVGEYEVPKTLATDPVPFLIENEFVMVVPRARSNQKGYSPSVAALGRSTSVVNSVWINTRAYERFKNRDYMCDVMGAQGVVLGRESSTNTKGVGHQDVMDTLIAVGADKKDEVMSSKSTAGRLSSLLG